MFTITENTNKKKGRKLVKNAVEVQANIYGVSHYPLYCSHDDHYDGGMDAGDAFVWIIKVLFTVDDNEMIPSIIPFQRKPFSWNGLVDGHGL